MKGRIYQAIASPLLLIASVAYGGGTTVTTRLDAAALYESAFIDNLMRGDDGAIVLNDLVLYENDGPGAGYSEKGVFEESLHRGVQVKKLFQLRATDAKSAHVCVYLTPQSSTAPPYYLLVNGQHVDGIARPALDGIWHWVPVPADALRVGLNEIVVVCDAPEGEGYNLLFAREDEYEAGGGTLTYKGGTALLTSRKLIPPLESPPLGYAPIEVGATSARSTDGGRTWSRGVLGAEQVAGEYTIRLHLERYHDEGALTTLPLDLWHDPDRAQLVEGVPAVSVVTIESGASSPLSTGLEWSVRFGDSADPYDPSWGEFIGMARGDSIHSQIDADGKRYIQIRVQFYSQDAMHSPALHWIRVTRDLEFPGFTHGPIYVREMDNPEIQYSSHIVAWQSAPNDRLRAIRERLDLDTLLEGAEGDFEKINRVRHHVSTLWYHELPLPEYPAWNTLDVLDRKDRRGAGGMCIQFVVVLMDALHALGYQARHVNVFNHETLEVYVNELGKWVLVDPESLFDSYEFDTRTGEPLNVLEQHAYFLTRYGLSAENPIRWMNLEPWCNWQSSGVAENPQPLDIATATDWINDPDASKRPPQHGLAGFVRMIPRNDFLDQPTPRPLSQGSSYWPWSGYVCWYDEATPRMLHYALHTDRVTDFYPTLNRVAFTVTRTETPGEVRVAMTSQTPNFAGYEYCVGDGAWQDVPTEFTYPLAPSAPTRLEMRTRNTLGVRGKPSRVDLIWHYQEPYRPKSSS